MSQFIGPAKDALLAQLGVGSSNLDVSIKAVQREGRKFKVVHRGWLEKKGDLRKKWLKRYVILCVPKTIFYFKTEEGADQFLSKSTDNTTLLKNLTQGSIPINGQSVITKVGKMDGKEDQKDNVFTIKPKHDHKRVFTFSAPSTDAMEEWLRQLNEGEKAYLAKEKEEKEKKDKEAKEKAEQKALEEKKLKEETAAKWIGAFQGGSIQTGDVTWQYIDGKISDGQRTWKWVAGLGSMEIEEPNEESNQGYAAYTTKNELLVMCYVTRPSNWDGTQAFRWTEESYSFEEKDGNQTYSQYYNKAKWQWKDNQMSLIEGKVNGPVAAKVTGSVPHPVVMWCLASYNFTPKVKRIRDMCMEYNELSRAEYARREKCVKMTEERCPGCGNQSSLRQTKCYNCGAYACPKDECHQQSWTGTCPHCGAFADHYFPEPNDKWKRETREKLLDRYNFHSWKD